MVYMILLMLCCSVIADNVIYYETLTGNTINLEQYQKYVESNRTFWCTGSYKPCNPSEGRRMDVSCNNLQYPYKGTPHTPANRFLPAQFGCGYTPVKTKSGQEMPLTRKVRLAMLEDGSIPDQKFTNMVSAFLLFMTSGITSTHDTINYNFWTPTCCLPEGKKNPMCAPIEIPADDPVFRFSSVRCMNLTKPLTYQSQGCMRNNNSEPIRINSESNFFDLSAIYTFDNSFRLMKDGLLQYDKDEYGRIWPVSTEYPQFICMANDFPKETRCHKSIPINGLYGFNYFSIIFWRLHNHIASMLKDINPHWNDEKLFSTAKDINIAICQKVYIYETLSDLMGKENLIREGILTNGFRDIYDENLSPRITTEYLYSLRWAHTIQPGMTELYDGDGNYLSQIQTGDLTLRTGFFAVGRNMEGLTQGMFRQPSAKIDHTMDPFLATRGLGSFQYAFDITAADLQKGGLLGIQSYTKYREFCTGRRYTSYNDLTADVDPEYIEIMKRHYPDVEDVPLLVGLWTERMIPGGDVPRTLYCISVKQLKEIIQYDRHWFERPNRPNAFTRRQLEEVREASMAWVFCAVGDSVTSIQPRPFLRAGPGNEYTSCDNISQVDFTAWKDKCQNK